jgi:hypothetical protein
MMHLLTFFNIFYDNFRPSKKMKPKQKAASALMPQPLAKNIPSLKKSVNDF